MTAVVDRNGHVMGVFTDGDLRRALDRSIDVHTTPVKEVMTANCKTARPTMLAVEVLKLMEDHKISSLPVVDEGDRLTGAINMHDLLRAGVV
jgi:arabinose-5-phosphate isomerase